MTNAPSIIHDFYSGDALSTTTTDTPTTDAATYYSTDPSKLAGR